MEASEAKQFCEEVLFIHFPAINGWLKQHSPKPDETLKVWGQVLHDVSVQEALRVVYRWTTGELPSPNGYEYQDVARHLRAVVMQDRYEARKHLTINEIRDQPLTGKRPILMSPYIVRILSNGDLYKSGKITLDECKRRNNEIIKEHDEAGKR